MSNHVPQLDVITYQGPKHLEMGGSIFSGQYFDTYF